MLFDLIDIAAIRRAILYGFCVIAAVTVQNSILCRISIFGAKAMILPVIVVSIGLFEGGFRGGMFGLLTGLLADAASSDTTIGYSLLFALIGFFAGFLADMVINRRFWSCLIVTAAALLVTAAWQIVPVWIYKGASLAALLPAAGLQSLWALPFTLPAYFACKAISGRKRLN